MKTPSSAPFTSIALAVLAVGVDIHLSLLQRRLSVEQDSRPQQTVAAEVPAHVQNIADKADTGQDLWPNESEILSDFIETHGETWNAYRAAKYRTYTP